MVNMIQKYKFYLQFNPGDFPGIVSGTHKKKGRSPSVILIRMYKLFFP